VLVEFANYIRVSDSWLKFYGLRSNYNVPELYNNSFRKHAMMIFVIPSFDLIPINPGSIPPKNTLHGFMGSYVKARRVVNVFPPESIIGDWIQTHHVVFGKREAFKVYLVRGGIACIFQNDSKHECMATHETGLDIESDKSGLYRQKRTIGLSAQVEPFGSQFGRLFFASRIVGCSLRKDRQDPCRYPQSSYAPS